MDIDASQLQSEPVIEPVIEPAIEPAIDIGTETETETLVQPVSTAAFVALPESDSNPDPNLTVISTISTRPNTRARQRKRTSTSTNTNTNTSYSIVRAKLDAQEKNLKKRQDRLRLQRLQRRNLVRSVPMQSLQPIITSPISAVVALPTETAVSK